MPCAAGLVLMAGAALACGPRAREPIETVQDGRTALAPAPGDRGGVLVRVVNALPDGRVDIVAGDSVLFSAVGPREVTDFKEITEQSVSFTLRRSGQDSAVVTNRELMMGGSHYTLVAVPTMDGGIALRALQDETAAADRTKIRVINAVTGSDDLKVVVQGRQDPLFSDLDVGEVGGWSEVDPATSTLLTIQSPEGATVARVDRMELEAGRAYTVVLTGTRGNVQTFRFGDRVVSER